MDLGTLKTHVEEFPGADFYFCIFYMTGFGDSIDWFKGTKIHEIPIFHGKIYGFLAFFP